MPKPVYVPGKESSGVAHVSAEKRRMGEVLIRKADTEHFPFQNSEDIVNPAYVASELAVTKNMDRYGFSYESLKIGVVISSPCENTPEAKVARAAADLETGMEILAREAQELSEVWFPADQAKHESSLPF